jgi:YjbE family integral membrane protein
METLLTSVFWIALLQIIWINIILSGDNAVVIALAARSLPPQQQKQAILWGSVAAIVLRIVLTIFAVKMLTLPYLKLIGSVLLLWIGIQLLLPEDEGAGSNIKESNNLFTAIKTILIADLVMSLDNVLGVAAAAKDNIILLVIGLAISIPLIIFGSKIILKLMERFPIIITLGGALLGYVAGEMAVTDPAIKDWINTQMAFLHEYHVGPIAGAILVLIIGKWLARKKQNAKPIDLIDDTKSK